MKTKALILVSIFLLTILTLSAVSADENITDTNSDNSTEVLTEPIETPKIDNYTYTIENMPEGDISISYKPLEVRDLPHDAEGNISIFIDGDEKYNKEVSPLHNQLFLDKLNLKFGKHIAEVKYSGDAKYAGFVKNTTFNYNYISIKVPEEIVIEDSERSSIFINYVEGIKGNIEIQIDDNVYYDEPITWDENEDYLLEIRLYDLTYEKHNYKITYYNGNYKKLTKKGSFIVSGYLFDVNYDKKPIYYGDEITFDITLAWGFENMTVQMGNKTYTTKIDCGLGEITLSDFVLGENNISFTYEDNEYPEQTVMKTINVMPKLNAPESIGYMDNQSISINAPPETTGTLTVRIDNETHTAELVNGNASFSLNNLTPNTYTVSITTSGEIKKYLDNITYTLTVRPNIILPKKAWIHDRIDLKFNAPEDHNGILSINNINYTVVDGNATAKISGLKIGNNTFIISYKDNNHTYDWKLNIEAFNDNPNWDIEFRSNKEILNGEYSEIRIMNAPYEPNLKGTITLLIDGIKYGQYNTYYMYEEYDFAMYPHFSNMTEGNHTLTLSYSGDDYYHAVNKSKTFEIKNVAIQISQEEITQNNNAIIVTVPSDDVGTLTINIDGEKFKTQKIRLSEGYDDEAVKRYYFYMKDYNAHEIEVIYSGKYGEITKKSNVKVPYDIYIYDSEDLVYGEKREITVSISPDLTNDLEVLIDGEKYPYVNDYGSYLIILPADLSIGNHTLSIKYLGDKIYPEMSVNETLTVKGKIQATEEYPEEMQLQYTSKESITLKLEKNATGNLTMYLSDSENGEYSLYKTVALKDGYASIDLPTSKIERYYYKAIYDGNYEVDEQQGEVTVYPIITYPKSMTWGQNKYLTATINNSTKARLIITKVFDEDYDDVKFNGNIARISLSKLDIGYHNEGYFEALVFIDGVEVYSTSIDIIVKPITPKLQGGKNINMQYNDGTSYSVKVYGVYGKLVGAGEIVTFKIGKKTYKVKTDKKGVAKLKLSQTPGKYTIKVSYEGKSITNKLTVKQILTVKTVKVKKSAKKLVLTATLKKVKGKYLKGKKITFKFNGKKYTSKTNKKGIAKVTIKKSVLKKLKVGKKITYQATYLKDTLKKTAKVKR